MCNSWIAGQCYSNCAYWKFASPQWNFLVVCELSCVWKWIEQLAMVIRAGADNSIQRWLKLRMHRGMILYCAVVSWCGQTNTEWHQDSNKDKSGYGKAAVAGGEQIYFYPNHWASSWQCVLHKESCIAWMSLVFNTKSHFAHVGYMEVD